jgi:hypothetical protein
MLSSEEQELLTTYVDGELSGPKRRLVARLLRRSPEARTLLGDLQGDSRELRAMPALGAPVDLSSRILRRIEAAPRPVLRIPRRVAPKPARFPLYCGLAAAAAVLLLVGLGSFFLHLSDRPATKSGDGLAHQQDPVENKVDPTANGLAGQTKQPDEKAPVEVVRHPKPPETPKRPSEDEEEDNKPVVVVTPDPDRPDGPILTAPGRESRGVLERVELALPTFHRLHSLDQPDQAKALAGQLTGPAYRVEITARNASRGFARLRQVFADRKINLVLDPTAAKRLEMPQRRTDFGLFLENVPAADLVAILAAVGTADRLGGDKKPSEMRFDGSLVVKEMSPWDRRELAEILSIDPVKDRPTVMPPPAVDITRPLDEQTAAQVAASLQGKGPTRPGSTATNLSAYAAMLTGPRDRSLDLKLFLATRLPARPGSVQVFLVLRNVAP